ncbi:hypothetical protein GmHk_12G035213 [Glycine max]|nr:hypothetical protein GmHk_12G035213 [Glycine max]
MLMKPQQHRPITSAPAPIAKDVQHVDHVADEVHEQPEETTANDVVLDAEGFPSGSHDTLVLIGYVHHVTVTLKLSSHRIKVEKFGRHAPKTEDLVVATRLSHLIACSLDTGDQGLISTFAKSFHLPVGEMTITLDNGHRCFIYPSQAPSIASRLFVWTKPCCC